MLKHTETSDQTPPPARRELGDRNAHLLARDRAAFSTGFWLTAVCLALTFAYAYVRYVHFGPIDPAHVPLYITNKAVSWSATLLIGIAMLLGPLARLFPRPCARWLWHRKTIGLLGASLTMAHLLLSLPIFNMFYYTSFFDLNGTLKYRTELSLLAGTLAWGMLLFPVGLSIPSVQSNLSGRYWLRLQSWNLWVLVLTFGHVAWLGWLGWFKPAEWYGGLPPITLLACGFIAVVFSTRVAARFRG